MVGLVLSMLTLTVVVAVFPAVSTAVPVMVWLAPSSVRVTGVGQAAMPDNASPQVKVTVTSPLFQPLVLAACDTEAVIAGGVLSTLRSAVTEAVLPARSTAV